MLLCYAENYNSSVEVSNCLPLANIYNQIITRDMSHTTTYRWDDGVHSCRQGVSNINNQTFSMSQIDEK